MTSYEVPNDYSALKTKTILITGCATGIGRETAKFAYGKWKACRISERSVRIC